jgi:hypothetical protein
VRENPRGQAHSKTQSAADVKKAAQSAKKVAQSAKKVAQSAKKGAQAEAPASTAAPLRRKRQAAQTPRPSRRSEEPAHSVEARTKVREQLQGDVEAFLKDGGMIQEISKDVRSDPPKKPESKYGSGSL